MTPNIINWKPLSRPIRVAADIIFSFIVIPKRGVPYKNLTKNGVTDRDKTVTTKIVLKFFIVGLLYTDLIILKRMKPDATSFSLEMLVFAGNKLLESSCKNFSSFSSLTSKGIPWRHISFSSIATVNSSSISPG